ncbi:peptidyl-prolyl cis-trans isomerase CPR6-like [Chenopodium quinoa]|uniref:peptidyl-prolyl cis-trans isomerase CPR6-like n=1 Tax=Chenopodium quinoa TaxID=63459 RepID=UPI000B77C901|nr:peptidyl-prolyl cis-trans isomerase CPR6-like [Chenopodium quinoa]
MGLSMIEGLKFLYFGLTRDEDEDDNVMLWNLVIALELNLTTCALKVRDYDQTMELCSISLVIMLDSSNAKALYRRALAKIKLHHLEEAYKDLSKADKVELNNHDILRELDKVKGLSYKASKFNGKRVNHVIWSGKPITTVVKKKDETISPCLNDNNDVASSIEEGSEVLARDYHTTDITKVVSIGSNEDDPRP